MSKADDTFEALGHMIWQHLVDRDWDNPTPRSLAISLSLEANELLEHYQWQDEPIGDKEALSEELADVLMYALQYAHVLGIDPAEAIRDKLAKSAKKYPAADFKGKDSEQKHKKWLEAKINHRNQKKTL
jgi:NTP pyrophosphatase (non-canonical NTP hydrolase)